MDCPPVPAHLLLLDHTSGYDLVDRALNEGDRNWLAGGTARVIIDQRGSVRFEISYQVVEMARWCPNALDVADAPGFCPATQASKLDQATLPPALAQPKPSLGMFDIATSDHAGVDRDGADARAAYFADMSAGSGAIPPHGYPRCETFGPQHFRPTGAGTQPPYPEWNVAEERTKCGRVVPFAQKLCPAVLTPAEPLPHHGNLSADDLRLDGCRQRLAPVSVRPRVSGMAKSSRSIRATSVSETTPGSGSATSLGRQISLDIAPQALGNEASAYRTAT